MTVRQCESCEPQRAHAAADLGLRPGQWDYLVALVGNPNTGKSTVFNALTGLRQHTGNWPGKTVSRAEGDFEHAGRAVRIVDLPGTYSLFARSADEEVTRDFIHFGKPDVTVIVVDATRLERNLNLTLQVLEITDKAVVCLNLVDEARRHGIQIDADGLSKELGVPVIRAAARRGEGIRQLRETIDGVATGSVKTSPFRIERYAPEVESAVGALTGRVHAAFPEIRNSRWVALRLLSGDDRVESAIRAGDLQGRPPGDGVAADVLRAAKTLRWKLSADFHDSLTKSIYGVAQGMVERCVSRDAKRRGFNLDAALDRLLTSRWTGFPVMFLVLAAVLWITVSGANVPSRLIGSLLLDTVHPALKDLSAAVGLPWWLDGFLLDGVYLATAWVVSVMLPPMAIFFPMFTLLEDFGYLPRVAFNLDKLFHKAGAHGKQALTMCMGFGCNAAGVVSTRIIDSPRERLIAVITNNFSLCNGRWPTQILIATIFLGAVAPVHVASLVSAGSVVGIALLGVAAMFLCSWLLSATALRGEATTFSLELPPYRPPRILQTLYTSLVDRTMIVLWRAVVFAAPAGAVIWLVSNVTVGGTSIAGHLVLWLEPFGLLVGLNGVILVAYIVAIPANEIVIPTVLMLTALTGGLAGAGGGAGVMFEADSAAATGDLLRAGGWTVLTGINVMLFSLLHNPCSTTLYTIYRETRSAKWTAVSALLPLSMGFTVCFLVSQIWRLLSA